MSTHDAGRELDALIAEKVMGWRLEKNAGIGGGRFWVGGPDGPRFPYMPEGDEPEFSTDIAAAWLIVQKERTTDGGDYERYWQFVDCCELGWRAELWSVPNQSDAPVCEGWDTGTDLPLAICRAALRAAGCDPVSMRVGESKPAEARDA